MRIPLLTILVLALINALTDTYIYYVLKRRCHTPRYSRIQLWTAMLCLAWLIAICMMPFKGGDETALKITMWMLLCYITVYIPKYFFVITDIVGSIPVLWHSRPLRWPGCVGLTLGIMLSAGIWWGTLVNRFRIDVNEVTVPIVSLPAAFDNYRIVQLSDLHIGTYGNDSTFVNSIVDTVNALHPDLIVFTGDLVNRRTDELLPFVNVLGRLHAPDGVMSVLGNHDYGDYYNWRTLSDKIENKSQMVRLQHRMGWRLLLNQTDFIRRGADSLAVIGVENIGDPPFAVYGDLNEAYPAVADSVCKILLSHNPAHWDNDIQNNDAVNIALTLSGHTHAMQIELAGVSPASLRYRHWGGLYDNKEYIDVDGAIKYLYVNIGLGTVGIPMRFGATPEITVITLKGVPAP